MFTRLIFTFLLGLLYAACACAQANEYEVKAAFLYNFARYVEWPADAFANPTSPIALCVLGRNPFGGALEQAAAGKLIEGRPFVVRQISDIQQPLTCQILFVTAAEKKKFRAMPTSLKSPGVLTVGEMPGFTVEGGVVNFKLEDGKVRFDINAEAAGQQHLRISSKLLSLAQTVTK